MRDSETVPSGEQAVIDALVRLNLSTLEASPHGVPRGQHGKGHGLATARFEVEADIPDSLRAGVFAAPGAFEALIRFSNGRQTDDRKADAHGMAIKLVDVREPDATGPAGGQDFVLVDHEVFFLAGAGDYLDFNRRAVAAKGSMVKGLLFLARLKLFERDLGGRIAAFTARKPASPLASPYWSTTPYYLGDTPVKYAVIPKQEAARPITDRDGLRAALVQELAAGEARFDFGVHVQTDAARQPVEDATVNWSEGGAPFVKLATITLPRQQVGPPQEAEDMVFTPCMPWKHTDRSAPSTARDARSTRRWHAGAAS